MSDRPVSLRRQLGLTAVIAVVVGDMMGSGIFFTPGELASVATARWQVYFFWSLAGVITLSGALTLAELSSRIPRAGASYHVIREGFGPFWAFLKIWIEIGVSGPGVGRERRHRIRRVLGTFHEWIAHGMGCSRNRLFRDFSESGGGRARKSF